ncbi:hypothetical protein [Parvularcula marina]|uniref:hypothetical protein n=1 Tax=Parvularcula marina TaxID=2292771 RepID=UPI003515D640
MRAVVILVIIVAIGFVTYLAIKTSPEETVRIDDPEVRIASRHEAAARDLAHALDDAVKNAQQAEQVAARLDEAIAESRAASRELLSLRRDNEAVPTSYEAIAATTNDAERATRMMRIYASRLNSSLSEAEPLSDQAVEMAEAIEKVEESQAEAEEAIAAAKAVKEEVATATRQQAAYVAPNTPRRNAVRPSDDEADVHIRVQETAPRKRDGVDRIVIGEPGR